VLLVEHADDRTAGERFYRAIGTLDNHFVYEGRPGHEHYTRVIPGPRLAIVEIALVDSSSHWRDADCQQQSTDDLMRTLIVSEFVTLDGVMQAPGGKDEDRDGGFEYGGWTVPYWHDDIGKSFMSMMKDVDAFLLGRRTYVTHAEAFEPMPAGNPFGDIMNPPKKYVVSKTLQKPIWRNTTIIRDNVIEAVRALKAEPGRKIMIDGSS
jgi:dihydrofolate reductase